MEGCALYSLSYPSITEKPLKSEPLTRYLARSSWAIFSKIISDLLYRNEFDTFSFRSIKFIFSGNSSDRTFIDSSLGFCSISIANEKIFLSSASTTPSRESILPLLG